MQSETVRKLGQVLGSAYPAWKANEGTGLIFTRILEGLDEDAVLAAAWTWVRERKWPPAPSELREAAERYVRYLERGQGGRVVHLRVGTTSDVAFDREALRGLLDLARAENPQALWQRDEIQRQTRRSAEDWLREWDEQAASELEMRRAEVRERAQGKWGGHGSLPALPPHVPQTPEGE